MKKDDPTRAPKRPPFPVGTRLRCLRSGDTYVGIEHARAFEDHPEDWTRASGAGLEVVIDEVKPGRRGTGAQLRDSDGPMFWDDTGDPMLDETKDGYSVFHITDRTGKRHGRIIWPANKKEWLVLK